MSQSTLRRWTAITFVLGAISNLVFLMTAGMYVKGVPPSMLLTGGYSLSHQTHLYAALLFLFTVFGLYHCVFSAESRLWTAGVIFSLLGNGLFCATGVYTAFLIPDICRLAPDLFTDPHTVLVTSWVFAATVTCYAIGWILTGILFWRTPGFPRWASVTLMLGAFVDMLPPDPWGPFPWLTQDLSGILILVAAVALARQLWGLQVQETRVASA